MVPVAAFISSRTEAKMVESTPVRIEPVVYVRLCRERGDTWEKIAATGAFVDQKTGEPLTGAQSWEWYERQLADSHRGGHGPNRR
jgi:hypothetical protein